MKRSEKMMLITPKEAQRLLGFNTFSGQRNVRHGHVEDLAEKMKDGRFHIGNIAIVQAGESRQLADGQHQLSACVLAQKPFKAVVQEYVLEDGDDNATMAKVFSQFNVDNPRTRGDIVWIFASELGWKWQRKFLQNLATALSIVDVADLSLISSKEESAAALSQHRKFCEWAHGMEFSDARHMNRVPVLAAVVATYRKNAKAAEEFWIGVRDGEALRKGDARMLLREYLKDVALKGSIQSVKGKDVGGRRAMYVKCIHAWNAWRSDRTTALKYHAASPIPRAV